MSQDLDNLEYLRKVKGTVRKDIERSERRASEVPVDGDCWKEAQVLIMKGNELLEMLDQEEATLILGSEWDTCQVHLDRDKVQSYGEKQLQATAPSQDMDLYSALESEK